MKIQKDKSVALTYVLKVGGDVIETVKKDKPLKFIFGQGYLLPKFEENLAGKEVGDTFEFELKAADAYGEVQKEAFIELAKDVFKVDGKIDESLFKIGNSIPMRDGEGNRLNGTVDQIKDDSVIMNFNHPLAGCTLDFSGEVVDVHDVTDEELAAMQHKCNCGNDGCDGNCSGDHECGDGNCDCGHHN